MKPRLDNDASQEHTRIDLNSLRPLVLTRHIISEKKKEEKEEKEEEGCKRRKRTEVKKEGMKDKKERTRSYW